MSIPKVFIIVLHYHSIEDTQECLKSLEKLDYDNFEVVIVDNGTEEKPKFQSPNFKLTQIFNKENLGFAGGNNVGIRYALEHGAEYVLLLNNDTIIEPSFLKKLIKAGESNKKIGILGPIIYQYPSTGSGQEIHFAGGKVNWLYTKGTHISTISTKRSDQASSINEADYITGACMLVKQEVIEKIGLMPEEYFLYLEDVDWCLKARREGFKCIIVPKARIWHKVSQSAKQGSFSYIYYHFRNGLLLAKRNAAFFIKLLAYLNSFWIYSKQILKLIISPKKREWARAIMKGIEDFYRSKFGKLT